MKTAPACLGMTDSESLGWLAQGLASESAAGNSQTSNEFAAPDNKTDRPCAPASSGYLNLPLRSEREVREATRYRFYVSGKDKHGDWETCNEFAETPAIALAQALDHAEGTGWDPVEVDPIPDAMIYAGKLVAIDREAGRRIALEMAAAKPMVRAGVPVSAS